MVGVLFVCMGNICRSPMAEGAFRALADERGLLDDAVGGPAGGLVIDSAGTIGYHAGSPPDPRAVRTAARHGVDISALRARQVEAHDFEAFDYILAMDRENFDHLKGLCPPGREDRLSMLLTHAADVPFSELPDPYYGEEDDFVRCFDLARRAADGLFLAILQRHFPARM